MTERPIIMQARSVLGILAGTKTQTRRVAKLPNKLVDRADDVVVRGDERPHDGYATIYDGPASRKAIRCRWAVGDRLWVREAWIPRACLDCLESICHCGEVRVDYPAGGPTHTMKPPTGWRAPLPGRRSPPEPCSPLFMPRMASRLTLDVRDVHLERLSSISEADARAEGFEDRAAYLTAWESMHGPGDFIVWVITFARLEG